MKRDLVERVAAIISSAQALLITAGAGMSVDSGLPDFRGTAGFWNAYPPYAKLKLDFYALARPEWFETDPALAWGFYGHRLELYRRTVPHAGYGILLEWCRHMPLGAFVFTSNVDGQFQRAGFSQESVTEVHGSIHWLQCLRHCGIGIFSADSTRVDMDPETLRARKPLPVCPSCGSLARPNILMFNDGDWEKGRSKASSAHLNSWLRNTEKGKLVIVECGAGTAVPAIRFFSEQIAHLRKGPLIRINPREAQVAQGHVGLAATALEGLKSIQTVLNKGNRD